MIALRFPLSNLAAILMTFGPLSLACNEQSDLSATRAATPLPTEEAIPPDFHAFALLLDSALAENNLEFFSERLDTIVVACSAEDVSREDNLASCDQIGAKFDGINFAYWRSGGSAVVPVERVLVLIAGVWLEADPNASDAYGDSAPQVFAVGRNDQLAMGPGYITVITSVVRPSPDQPNSESRRVALLLGWHKIQDDWRLFDVVQVYEMASDVLDPTIEGRAYIEHWHRF